MFKSPEDIDVAILMLFYHFSDQYGKVNMKAAKEWANTKLGIILKDHEFNFTQAHLDFLINQEVIFDTTNIMSKITDVRQPSRFFL